MKPGMVWIPKKLGSNKAAHWAPADSAEAKDLKGSGNIRGQDLQDMQSKGISGQNLEGGGG